MQHGDINASTHAQSIMGPECSNDHKGRGLCNIADEHPLALRTECSTIYIYIYSSVLVNEMPKSARYHIDRANSIVFTSKRLPLQPVSSERNHQVADKFRKVSCLNVYGRKRGRVGVKQCMHVLVKLHACIVRVKQCTQLTPTRPRFRP